MFPKQHKSTIVLGIQEKEDIYLQHGLFGERHIFEKGDEHYKNLSDILGKEERLEIFPDNPAYSFLQKLVSNKKENI